MVGLRDVCGFMVLEVGDLTWVMGTYIQIWPNLIQPSCHLFQLFIYLFMNWEDSSSLVDHLDPWLWNAYYVLLLSLYLWAKPKCWSPTSIGNLHGLIFGSQWGFLWATIDFKSLYQKTKNIDLKILHFKAKKVQNTWSLLFFFIKNILDSELMPLACTDYRFDIQTSIVELCFSVAYSLQF